MLVIPRSKAYRLALMRIELARKHLKTAPVMQEPRTLYPADPKSLLRGRGFFGGYR